METFAVAAFPVAKPDEWRAFADSIASGSGPMRTGSSCGGWESSVSMSAIRQAWAAAWRC